VPPSTLGAALHGGATGPPALSAAQCLDALASLADCGGGSWGAPRGLLLLGALGQLAQAVQREAAAGAAAVTVDGAAASSSSAAALVLPPALWRALLQQPVLSAPSALGAWAAARGGDAREVAAWW